MASTAGHAAPLPVLRGPATAREPAKAAPRVHPAASGTLMLPCNPDPAWPAYAAVGYGIAPNPFIPNQIGCPLYESQDEVHLTYLSEQPGSGARWTDEIHLPAGGNQTASYSAVYLGMVVQGDKHSAWGESYLEVSFFPDGVPGGSVNYTPTISIYSLVNGTSGNPQVFACPAGWNSLAWNGSGWCEGSDFSNGAGIEESTPMDGNSWVNVTFSGVAGSKPVTIWANDSTSSAASFTATMNSATTGTYNFTPESSAACQQCLLEWGMGFGEGVGFGMCPGTSPNAWCDSYDIYPWTYDDPVELGIPEYFNGTGYTGDFAYLGFESASGACTPINGLTYQPISICITASAENYTGYYPFFTYNGSLIDFGAAFPWTTWDLGGVSNQFDVQGTMTARSPIYSDSIQDSSQGGYVTGGEGFNVTTRLQVVGHVHNGSLVYRLGDGLWDSLPLTQVNGSSTIGYWNATVPSTGPNGTFTYWVFAEDDAGTNVSSQLYNVIRGPIPTFEVKVATLPPHCGGVVFNSTEYTNGAVISTHPGDFSLRAITCYAYIDPTITGTANVIPHPITSSVVVRGNGTLTLHLTFSPPPLSIQIAVGPSGCGTISIGGTAYSGGSTATVTWNRTYTLAATAACSGDTVFGGYTFDTGDQFNVTVSTSYETFTAVANGTLTATFVGSHNVDPVLFATEPSGCQGILFGSVSEVNGTTFGVAYYDGTSISVANGSYPIAPDPCQKFGFLKWKVSGSATISDGTVDLNGSATITEINYALTIIYVVTSPSTCGMIAIDGTNYTNGAEVVVTNNTTHLTAAYACQGYTLIDFTSTGGLHLNLRTGIVTANGSGELIAAFQYGPLTAFVGFVTSVPYCGAIIFNGVTYHDTNYTEVPIGTVATLNATDCPRYGLLEFSPLGLGISIVNDTATINGPGAIEAVFTALVNLYLYTSPSDCGAIVLNGVAYTDGSSPEFPEGINLTLAAQPCAGRELSSWLSETAVVYTGFLNVPGPATLTAIFLPESYNVSVLITPADCGSVTLDGVPAFNNTTHPLPAGVYPITVRPCQGDSVIGYTVVGNLTLSKDNLTVAGAGSINILMEPVAPTVTLYLPSSTASGGVTQLAVTVTPTIPPYNYTYDWSFGDGGSATTTTNFTDHTYASPGDYHVVVRVTDPLGRVVSANGTVDVVAVSSTAPLVDLVPAALAVAAAVVVIAAAYVYSTPRAPEGPAPDEELGGGEGPAAIEEGSGALPGPEGAGGPDEAPQRFSEEP